MLLEPVEAYVPCEYRVKLASDAWELGESRALRRAVFCDEQGIFIGDDTDGIDRYASTIVAVSCIAGVPDQVVGTVRIHQEGPATWYGSRLAVQPLFRRVSRIGTSLIRMAVGSAHARGCRVFLAYVQKQNVAMFERLHWRSLREVTLHGRLHDFMQADLSHYPPIRDGGCGLVVAGRLAA